MFVGFKVKVKDSAKLLYPNLGIFHQNEIGTISQDYGLTRSDRLVEVKFEDGRTQDFFFSELDLCDVR